MCRDEEGLQREGKRGEQDLNELQTSMQLLKDQQKLPLKRKEREFSCALHQRLFTLTVNTP